MRKSQWKRYQTLELIPPSFSDPSDSPFPLSQPLTALWRSLLNRWTRQFDSPKNVKHLENCWILKGNEHETLLNDDKWQFPSYVSGGLLMASEPNIWQTTDTQGQPHWHIYDPITGKITHRETEEEVRIWLKNRYSS